MCILYFSTIKIINQIFKFLSNSSFDFYHFKYCIFSVYIYVILTFITILNRIPTQ